MVRVVVDIVRVSILLVWVLLWRLSPRMTYASGNWRRRRKGRRRRRRRIWELSLDFLLQLLSSPTLGLKESQPNDVFFGNAAGFAAIRQVVG